MTGFFVLVIILPIGTCGFSLNVQTVEIAFHVLTKEKHRYIIQNCEFIYERNIFFYETVYAYVFYKHENL